MAQDLQDLSELVQQPNKDHLLQQAKAEAKASPSTSRRPVENSVTPESIIYLPSERKCNMFRSAHGIGADECVEEVWASMRASRFPSCTELHIRMGYSRLNRHSPGR